jgi:hypothetical protein
VEASQKKNICGVPFLVGKKMELNRMLLFSGKENISKLLWQRSRIAMEVSAKFMKKMILFNS